jgi:hypothetical protein
MKLVKPKPDISLAKKTGHFNLLTTANRAAIRAECRALRLASCGTKAGGS